MGAALRLPDPGLARGGFSICLTQGMCIVDPLFLPQSASVEREGVV